MTSDFFKKATDPRQYDDDRIDWSNESTTDSPFRGFILDYIKDFTSNVSGKRVIDIGAGTGWLVKVLVELGAESITAIEPSEKGVKFMREQYPTVSVKNVTVETMQPQGLFDLGFLLYITTHFKDLDESLMKVASVIKKGGDLVMTIPNVEYVKKYRLGDAEVEKISEDVFVAGIPREFGVSYDIYRTTDAHIKAAERAGFEFVKRTPMLPTEGLMNGFPRFREFEGHAISQLLIFKKR